MSSDFIQDEAEFELKDSPLHHNNHIYAVVATSSTVSQTVEFDSVKSLLYIGGLGLAGSAAVFLAAGMPIEGYGAAGVFAVLLPAATPVALWSISRFSGRSSKLLIMVAVAPVSAVPLYLTYLSFEIPDGVSVFLGFGIIVLMLLLAYPYRTETPLQKYVSRAGEQLSAQSDLN